MQQRLLRIRDLEYLLAVAEHRSFAKAATALSVTQPTLSNQIRKIEEALDCRAFNRQSREVELTPEGAIIVAHAQSVTAAFYELELAMKGSSGFLGGRLRFGVIPTVSPYLSAPLLSAIRARNETGLVSFQEAVTEELEAQVLRGDLDFAVTATLPKKPDLKARRLGVERLVYLSADPIPEDPFAIEPDGAASAGARPILLMHEGHCFRDAVYASIARVNGALAEAVDYDVSPTSLSTLVSLVRGRVGNSLLPAPFVAAGCEPLEGLATRMLGANPFQRTIHLIFRAGRETNVGLSQIEDLAAAVHREVSEAA